MKVRIPKYRLHKATGKAVVTLSGRDFYLGIYASKESHAAYRRIIGEYVASNGSPVFGEKVETLTMAQVTLAFLKHAKGYYPHGREYGEFERALKPVAELYTDLLASKFGPTEFKACRQWWLSDPKRSRGYINTMAKRLRAIIKWCVSEGLVPSSGYEAIRCVAPLKRGRTDAPETEPIKPVKASLVEATLKFLTPVLQDMVRFQQLVGCRPGEVCSIKPSMVDRSTKVWQINLENHKTAHRGKQRTIYVGPTAQKLLKKYLLRDSDSHCFSPIESDKQRRQAQHDARITPLSCGNKPGSNRVAGKPRTQPGPFYTTGTYAQAIKYACVRGKLEAWAPNQLRHSAATEIRRQFGLEAAASILGHSEIGVTQVYAEADLTRAVQVAMSR